MYKCFVESWQGQRDISMTCVTLVEAFDLHIYMLTPDVMSCLPASVAAATERRKGTTRNLRNVCGLPSSILLLFFLYGSLEGKLALFIPFGTLGIYLVMFWKILKDCDMFCLQLYDSEWLSFSLKSPQCHALHGKIKSCVYATEFGECAEYSLCFSVLVWPFKPTECSVPTWYVVADCHR